MPVEVFNFCPDRLVPETVPPEPTAVTSFNGWEFTSRPTVPFRRKFRVTLYGLIWYLDAGGFYDATTDPEFNARRLELFYQAHQRWREFQWIHPHIGPMLVKFASPFTVPAGIPNSMGRCGPLEITLIESNPGYDSVAYMPGSELDFSNPDRGGLLVLVSDDF